MSTANASTSEGRIEERRILEAVARHNERMALQARRRGDMEAVERFSKNAMAARRKQR